MIRPHNRLDMHWKKPGPALARLTYWPKLNVSWQEDNLTNSSEPTIAHARFRSTHTHMYTSTYVRMHASTRTHTNRANKGYSVQYLDINKSCTCTIKLPARVESKLARRPIYQIQMSLSTFAQFTPAQPTEAGRCNTQSVHTAHIHPCPCNHHRLNTWVLSCLERMSPKVAMVAGMGLAATDLAGRGLATFRRIWKAYLGPQRAPNAHHCPHMQKA